MPPVCGLIGALHADAGSLVVVGGRCDVGSVRRRQLRF